MSDDLSKQSLFELFRADVESHVQTLSDGLLRLEEDPSNQSEYQELMRAAHSVKGASRIIQLDIITDLAHSVEDCFVASQDGVLDLTSDHIDIFLEAVDVFQSVTEIKEQDLDTWQQEKASSIKTLIQKVKAILLPPCASSQKERDKELSSGKEDQKKEAHPQEEDSQISLETMDLADASMFELFRVDVESQAKVLSDGLINLEEDPSNPSLYEELMRAAHSVKGASRIIQLDVITQLAHSVEDCFVAAQKGKLLLSSEHIDCFLKAVDLFQSIAEIQEDQLDNWVSKHSDALKESQKEVIKLLDPKAKELVESASEKKRSEGKDSEHTPSKGNQLEQMNLEDASMFELFRADVEVQTQVLSDGLLKLEENPRDAACYEELMRAAHSVKGASRIIQLDMITELAHSIEDCFVSAQKGDLELHTDHIDVFLQGVDIFSSIAAIQENTLQEWIGEYSSKIDAVTTQSKRILNPQHKGGTPKEDQAKENTQTTPLGVEVSPSQNQEEQNKTAEPSVLTQTPQKKPPEPKSKAKEPASQGAKASLKTMQEKDRVLRVSADSLDRMMGLAGETLVESRWLTPFSDSLLSLKRKLRETTPVLDKLRDILVVISSNQRVHSSVSSMQELLSQCHQKLGESLGDLELFSRRSSNLSDRLYREAISSRMRPFSDGTHGFPRMVRDTAKKLGKKVKFEILGKETKVDRDILDKLEAPLNHILRNALDHGLENPQERQEKGKDSKGRLTLEASHQAGSLVITIKDDGKGVDLDVLRKKIVDKGLASLDLVSQLNAMELMDFMFLPGFSTKEQVSDISGRGVGLDVVQSMVQEVSGSLSADSELGRGTEFRLQLPLTLSVVSALSVDVAGEYYAFPLSRIDHTFIVAKEKIQTMENRQYINFEGENIGLVLAHQLLGVQEQVEYPDDVPVIVISNRKYSYGVAVNAFLGERDFVVQDLEKKLGKIPNISAGSLNDDGSPILLVNVEDMVVNVDKMLSRGAGLNKIARNKKKRRKRKRILIADDSITVREMESQLLKNYGYEVDLAVDGQDAWNAVRVGDYDLIITDIDMPRMNGLEFLSLIKGDMRFRRIPVIIVSYKDRKEDKKKGLELGAICYLTKNSLHDNSLVDAIKDVIGEGDPYDDELVDAIGGLLGEVERNNGVKDPVGEIQKMIQDASKEIHLEDDEGVLDDLI